MKLLWIGAAGFEVEAGFGCLDGVFKVSGRTVFIWDGYPDTPGIKVLISGCIRTQKKVTVALVFGFGSTLRAE